MKMNKKKLNQLLGTFKNKYIEFHRSLKLEKKDMKGAEASSFPKKMFYKAYARFDEIMLPKPHLKPISLKTVLEKRESCREFGAKPMSLNDLSTLLKYSLGINDIHANSKKHGYRFYPSAGARFPVEAYIIVRNVKGLESGVYHYYILNHSAEKLPEMKKIEPNDFFVHEWTKHAQCFIILTSIFERTVYKYGDLGYRFILEEAGFIGQNIYLVSESLGVGCSAISYYGDNLEKLLDIDGRNESVIAAFALGSKK